MRRSVSPALLLAFALAGCGSSDAPVADHPINLVVGVEAACAPRIDAVHLSARDGAAIVFKRDYMKLSATSFPLFALVNLPERAGAVYELNASFHVKSVNGEGTPISPSLSVLVPSGTEGRIVLSLPCVCLGVDCPEGENCAELPVGSGHAQCVATYQCGNHACEQGEAFDTCPDDCAPECGDMVCSQGEACNTCPKDCGSCCGNGACDPLEDCQVCPSDCGSCEKCPNGVCEPKEDCNTCPSDCPCPCGDGVCNGTESCNNCPKDCGSCCGNQLCEPGESCQSCPKDCGACPCYPPCGCGTACDTTTGTCKPFDTCFGKQCGDDGCGASCGVCPSSKPTCAANRCCTPGGGCGASACWQLDDCGKICGQCPSGTTCVEGTGCVVVCSCDGKECGDDGCGGDCGACWPGDVCVGNTCVCQPDCSGKACGWDGCSGVCGYCSGTDVCEGGICRACEWGKGCYEWTCWELDECYEPCAPCQSGYHCVTGWGCEPD